MIENSEGITALFIPFSDALAQSSDASFDSLGTRNDNYFQAPGLKYAKPKANVRVCELWPTLMPDSITQLGGFALNLPAPQST
jgi:hypothetical protein